MANLCRFFVVSSVFLFGWHSVSAQQTHANCRAIKYEHRNQIDYGPLHIGSIQGLTKDSDGVTVPRACVWVFAESDQRLLRASEADAEGHFEIVGVPNGRYRLVVSVEGLCPANVAVVLKARSHWKKNLVVTMKPGGIDECSYIELK